MAFIKSRKHAAPAVRTVGAAVLLSLAHGAAATDAPVDVTAPPQQAKLNDAQALPGLQVDADRGSDYRVDKVSSPKFTQSLLDTTQTIQVIDKELIQQQGATTLTEALRNSPGVGTFFVGENGATNTGDAIYMRGFDTSSSIFVDGVRDTGAVSRDVFNIEQIEVTKGPDGTEYGRTAPTGAVNLVTKQPVLGNGISGSVQVRQRAAPARHRRLEPGHGQRRGVPPQRDGPGQRRVWPRQGREQPLGRRAVAGLRPRHAHPRVPQLPAREAEQRARRRRVRPLACPATRRPMAARSSPTRPRSIRTNFYGTHVGLRAHHAGPVHRHRRARLQRTTWRCTTPRAGAARRRTTC